MICVLSLFLTAEKTPMILLVLQQWLAQNVTKLKRMELAAFRVEDFIPRSLLDKFFLGYYVFQIVSTLCLDMQGTLPAFLYPAWMRAIFTHHLETWRDPWLANTWHSPWYLSICLWEYSIHIPFFFVAAYAYYQRINGTDKCTWIRTPVIMYSTQLVTATSSVILMALMADFSSSEAVAPTNFFHRLKLAGMYAFFFFSCLLNLLDALTGRDYLSEALTGRGNLTDKEGKKKT